MTALVLQHFQGMYPRYGEQVISDNSASIARNCRLLSGELQALKKPVILADLTDEAFAIERVFKVLTETGFFYRAFDDPTIDFVKAPLVNDTYNRHYWTSETDYPRYADETVLEAGGAGYRLGVPAPASAPTVTPAATGGVLEETRVYVYTYVTSYGEESAPSPPTIAAGNADGTWTIGGMATTIPDSTERPTVAKNIYRTITGTTGSVEYFFVAQVSLATASYVEAASDTDVVSMNTILPSESWNEPPQYMRGLIAHPNGFLVGFLGRDVYMSVPYRPHAWPVEYILSTSWDIVGLGIVGQSIAVLTKGNPYTLSGVRPEAMSFVASDTPEPCLSRFGIVSTSSGVIYPGPDGLMLNNGAGQTTNLTKKLLSRRDWKQLYRPEQISAARHESQYVAFINPTFGFAIDFEEPTQALVELDSTEWDHQVLQQDYATGDVWLVRDNIIRLWNPVGGQAVTYLWRSKEFDFPNPVNLGAYKITFKETTSIGGLVENLEEQQAFNDERILHPLNPINFAAVNSVHVISGLTSTLPQLSQQMHKGPLYQTALNAGGGHLTFRIYVNREEDPVHEYSVEDMEVVRPPTGFRSILWEFELEGTVDVQTVKLASTPVELKKI